MYTNLSSFLLEFFNGSLVNTTTFVDHVTSGGGLAGVDVSNDNNVDMNLFLSHFGLFMLFAETQKENNNQRPVGKLCFLVSNQV